MYFDKYATLQRLTQISGDTDKEEFTEVARPAFRVNVQPANAETVALVEGVFGKTYTLFTKAIGIKDGDRVTISGTWTDGETLNKQLQVANVGNWSFYPLPHFEITCVELEQ